MCDRKNGKSQEINGIDKCISPFINLLHSNKINTQFSCCGHGSENPTIILSSYQDVVKLFRLLGKYINSVTEELTTMDNERWEVKFNGLICTPMRFPSWVDSKSQVEYVKKLRKDVWNKS